MKKLTILFAAMLLIQFVDAQSLTKAERKSAVKYLQWSSKELYKSLKALVRLNSIFTNRTDGLLKSVSTISLSLKALCGALWTELLMHRLIPPPGLSSRQRMIRSKP